MQFRSEYPTKTMELTHNGQQTAYTALFNGCEKTAKATCTVVDDR